MDKEFMTSAERINYLFSDKGVDLALCFISARHQTIRHFPRQKCLQLHILKFTSYLRKMKTQSDLQKKNISKDYKTPESYVCCKWEDFKLLPYEKFYSNRKLTPKRISGWSLSKPQSVARDFEKIIQKLSQKRGSEKHLITLVSLDKSQVEEDPNKKLMEEWMAIRNQKPERHFQLTRIIDYFVK